MKNPLPANPNSPQSPAQVSPHGLLLVDKPEQWTSHDLVDFIRKLFGIREVGHCGTLDPMASGLMVMLLGEATKLSHYVLEADKSYRLRFRLGLTTDTLDTTGVTLQVSDVIPELTSIQAAVRELQGPRDLQVPLYSAAKVDGKKLHEYAREGQEVSQPRKMMDFFALSQLRQVDSEYEVSLSCSKGSFVRSWIHELGQNLGCGAAMSGLVRTASHPYSLAEAHSVRSLQEHKTGGTLASLLIPMGQALPEYPAVRVSGQDEALLRNGQISHALRSQLLAVFQPGVSRGLKMLSRSSGVLLALVQVDPERGFVIRRGFRY